MTTNEVCKTRQPSFTCPAAQELSPGAKHTLIMDVHASGESFWTTKCTWCDEIPTCARCDWHPAVFTINNEAKYAIECATCGRIEPSTEREYNVNTAYRTAYSAMSQEELPRRVVAAPRECAERPYRLYKILITEVPEACDELGWKFDPELGGHVRHRAWKPAGWDEYVRARIIDGAKWDEDQHFFWPSEDKTYRSRSAAADKVGIVERWGGKAIILEAEVGSFVPATEAVAKRKRIRDQKRIDALKAKIAAIDPEAV